MNFNSCIGFKKDKKKFILAVIVAFIYIFISDFIIHGHFLKDAYMASASLWRPEAEMPQFMCWMLFGQFLIALTFTSLFAIISSCFMCHRGVCFGLMASLFSAAHSMIQYAVTPLPSSILWAWMITCIVQYVLLGVLLSFVYKPSQTCCPENK